MRLKNFHWKTSSRLTKAMISCSNGIFVNNALQPASNKSGVISVCEGLATAIIGILIPDRLSCRITARLSASRDMKSMMIAWASTASTTRSKSTADRTVENVNTFLHAGIPSMDSATGVPRPDRVSDVLDRIGELVAGDSITGTDPRACRFSAAERPVVSSSTRTCNLFQ